MTSQQHPITPPPELVQQWWAQETYDPFGVAISNLATQAARWGSDQELEACCKWMERNFDDWDKRFSDELRATRRSKPPSLKERARTELDRLIALIPTEGAIAMAEPIRRALEALDD